MNAILPFPRFNFSVTLSVWEMRMPYFIGGNGSSLVLTLFYVAFYIRIHNLQRTEFFIEATIEVIFLLRHTFYL